MEELAEMRGWDGWDGSHELLTSWAETPRSGLRPRDLACPFEQKQATSDRIGGMLLGLGLQSARTTPCLKWLGARPNQDWPRFHSTQSVRRIAFRASHWARGLEIRGLDYPGRSKSNEESKFDV